MDPYFDDFGHPEADRQQKGKAPERMITRLQKGNLR